MTNDYESLFLDNVIAGKRFNRAAGFSCLALTALPWLGWAFLDFKPVGAIAMAAVMFLIAIGFLLGSMGDPRKHPIFDALAHRRQDIVWVYTLVIKRNGVPTNANLILGFTDGKSWGVNLPLEREKEAMAVMHQLVPHATFGYSDATDRAFRTNPAALRQAV